jgi:hypothetical protein
MSDDQRDPGERTLDFGDDYRGRYFTQAKVEADARERAQAQGGQRVTNPSQAWAQYERDQWEWYDKFGYFR